MPAAPDAPSPLPPPLGQRRAARSGGRRPQRRGARGRRGRGGGRRLESTLPLTGQLSGTGLHIGALNIQSLKPKLLELTDAITRYDYDVFLLSETWLRPSTPNRLLVIPGYAISRADRPDGRGYGGVAIVTKAGITSMTLKLPNSKCPGSLLESQWAQLKLPKNRQLIVGSLYRPPRHSVAALRADFADLETQLQQIFINHPKVPLVICGDLNCDMLKSPSFPARQHICDFLSDYSMHQLVTAPTFASGSLLDVCLVKNREYVRNCSVSYCHFSPHKFVNVLVDVPKQRLNPTVILSRSFKRLDVQSFNCDLLTVDWEEVYKETSVSEKWQAFLKSFMPVIDDHAPAQECNHPQSHCSPRLGRHA